MNDWLKEYLAGQAIQPLLADIKTGRVRPSVVLLAIQQLSEEEKQTMKPALDLVMEVLQEVINKQEQAEIE
jgi:hypothetical protein